MRYRKLGRDGPEVSVAEEFGITLAQLVARPGVTCVIPGAKSPAGPGNAAAAAAELPPEALDGIETILSGSPG